ncbi:uncharacterized protein A1O5_12215 [Cladophialophora psammophila CBS 110553]|uniref:Uncharacterized protein n=1 Tax=Cladophialophora psammophila CBS 110553 TaxID=1182543 RepID=W9WLP3_9EURO|nr:uncharacterized protein A1O5_12215 [Cladophialophora psammophila CBS 110553]EXJ59334.1 hypothetical protein A1O5_12215 [Cladophialophora psammophila CBS 110553]
MDANTAIALASMATAILALFVAMFQVKLEESIEARRKGKIDKLALGEWAITWPETKLIIFKLSSLLHIRSPFDDPRVLTVPFITIGALQDCLRQEALAERRGMLSRRMTSRLVQAATQYIAIGGGSGSGRIYAVRETTRKKSEACWSDAMDMCGITRQYWRLLTSVSARTCDGTIRPAGAVTNLHSILGFARAMGLRRVVKQGTSITMTNGGASITVDLKASIDGSTQFAHFGGSPNSRYVIIDEMSQQTAESIYADALWAAGCVPVASRLAYGRVATALSGSIGKYREQHEEIVSWPDAVQPPILARTDPNSRQIFHEWASGFLKARKCCNNESIADPRRVSLLALTQRPDPAIITCIRTYPKTMLSEEQLKACYHAAWWCIEHWWLDSYQVMCQTRQLAERPRLPLPDVNMIGCEFVTDIAQAKAWCQAVWPRESVLVDSGCWSNCIKQVSAWHSQAVTSVGSVFGLLEQSILMKVLQIWKLNVVSERLWAGSEATKGAYDAAICEAMLLNMALLAIAADSSASDPSENNKVLEVEFG